MNQFLIVIAAFIPPLVLVHHFYKKDKNKPEPIDKILKVFFVGICISPICYFLNTYLFSFLNNNLIVGASIIAPIVEETSKFLAIILYIYKDKNFDEISDGILYTIVASLGFAFAENILYINWYIDSYGESIIYVRALLPIALHTSASGIMGYYIGKAKFSKNKTEEKNYFIKGLLLAYFIHGIYNFSASTPYLWILTLIILFFSFKFLYSKINIALVEDEISLNNQNSITFIKKSENKQKSNDRINPYMQKEINKILDNRKSKKSSSPSKKYKGYKKGDLYN